MKWDSTKVSTKKVVLSEASSCATNSSSSWTSVLGDEFLMDGVWEIVVETINVDNPSVFIGVASQKYWDYVADAAAEGEDPLPRDSMACICMHGDGRCFIKTQEKDWGLMRMATDSSVTMVLDFVQGLVSFKLVRTVRGKVKETVAEIPGLFPHATVVACFGGRDQSLVISSCRRIEAGEETKKLRDPFAEDAFGGERVAPVQLEGTVVGGTYDEQVRAVAMMSEGSM